MSIGTKVKKHREAKGWSQEDLATRLDTTQTTISNIESDKNIPNSLLLNKLAKELEINMNDLFEDKVTNINQIEKIEKEENKLLVYLNDNLEPAELNSYLFKQNITLTHLVKRKHSLEEQFLELTKQS